MALGSTPWTSKKGQPGGKALSKEFKKDEKAVSQYTGKRGKFALWLGPGEWKQRSAAAVEDAEVTFVHKDGDLYGVVIAERITILLFGLKRAAFERVRGIDAQAKLLKEEKRIVNGKEVLSLVINATVEDTPVTYYNYYYSG